MMRTTACFALWLLIPGLVLAGQDRLVSKKSKGFNSRPAIAVDPHTGNVLIVWERSFLRDLPPPNIGTRIIHEVWAAVAKRKGNGNYAKARASKLSSGQKSQALPISNFAPRAVWNDSNKEFLVVWQRGGESGDRSNDLMARSVHRKTGKPAGDILTMIDNKRVNETPFLTAASGREGAEIALFYSSRPVSGSSGRKPYRLERALIDPRDYSVGAMSTLSKYNEDRALRGVASATFDEQTARQSHGASSSVPQFTCSVLLEVPRLSFEQEEGEYFLSLYRGKKRVDRVSISGLGSAFSTVELGSIRLVNGTLAASMAGEWEPGLRNSHRAFATVKPGCSKIEVETGLDDWFLFGNATWLYLKWAELEDKAPSFGRKGHRELDTPGNALSYETDGRVYEQGFDENMNLVGNQEFVFDPNYTMTFATGADIPVSSSGDKPNAVVVWTKEVEPRSGGNLGKAQIRAHFLYLEPPD